MSDFNPRLEEERIVGWLKEQAAAAGVKGAVFGLSGGIDSAVVAALCRNAFGVDILGVILPCHSAPTDVEHAMLVAEAFDTPVKLIKLDDVYDSLLGLLDPDAEAQGRRDLAVSNLKPRLRMISLYFQANRLNYFVVGTGNRSEITVGYYTKYGDGGVDILPIAHLVKDQVRALAEHLGVPREVIDKPPSAGLWGGQTDEAEMGVTYEQLDRYILTGDAVNEIKERIETMKSASEHKRRMPASLESLG
ncbi:MAG: NAD(+) synthase [Candidatus Aquicultor sp.]|nr:NAD(+) synthase [Candidatus Aquicultor sp.]